MPTQMTFEPRHLLQVSLGHKGEEPYVDYIPPARDAITLPRPMIYILVGVVLVVVATYAIVGHLINDLMHDLAGNRANQGGKGGGWGKPGSKTSAPVCHRLVLHFVFLAIVGAVRHLYPLAVVGVELCQIPLQDAPPLSAPAGVNHGQHQPLCQHHAVRVKRCVCQR